MIDRTIFEVFQRLQSLLNFIGCFCGADLCRQCCLVIIDLLPVRFGFGVFPDFSVIVEFFRNRSDLRNNRGPLFAEFLEGSHVSPFLRGEMQKSRSPPRLLDDSCF